MSIAFKKTTQMQSLQKTKIEVFGLDYVGLPLAIEFGKRHDPVGIDINQARISKLAAGQDYKFEVGATKLAKAEHLRRSSDVEGLRTRNVYIVPAMLVLDEATRVLDTDT